MASSFELRAERELKDRVRQLEEDILRGNVEDWANYKYLCGEFRGIQFAIQVLKDALDEAIREEERED